MASECSYISCRDSLEITRVGLGNCAAGAVQTVILNGVKNLGPAAGDSSQAQNDTDNAGQDGLRPARGEWGGSSGPAAPFGAVILPGIAAWSDNGLCNG